MNYSIITPHGKIDIEGRPVKFMGFEEFEFFIHNTDFESIGHRGQWRVSEKITGAYFASGATSNEALKNAKQTLLEKGREKVRGIIKNNQVCQSLESKGKRLE